MPLKNFFVDQLRQLREFLNVPGRTVHVLEHDPDVKRMVVKLLVALEEDQKCRHVLVPLVTPFLSRDQYFPQALAELTEQNEAQREDLARQGIVLPSPAEESPDFPPERRFKRYVVAVADALPDWAGSYALIIDPPEIKDEAAFRQSIEYLAGGTRSDWGKYIVFDRRQAPILGEIGNSVEHVSVQVFHLAPEKIESQVKADLVQGRLSPAEKRQYTAMVAAFAFAHRRYDEAETTQREALSMAEQEGAPAEQASALYNLANTLLAKEQFAEAEATYNRAAAVCLEYQINPLLAMVLVNLGVAVHRQGRMDESLECFNVARRTFKAMDNLPGEAYALDCKAAVLALDNRNEEAERAWREALCLYDGITNPALVEIRNCGRSDIVDKLTRFFEATHQKAKTQEFEQQGAIVT